MAANVAIITFQKILTEEQHMTQKHRDLVSATGSLTTDTTAYSLLKDINNQATAKADKKKSEATTATVRFHTRSVTSVEELLDETPNTSWCCGLFGKKAPKSSTTTPANTPVATSPASPSNRRL
jgi:hypothetical protein